MQELDTGETVTDRGGPAHVERRTARVYNRAVTLTSSHWITCSKSSFLIDDFGGIQEQSVKRPKNLPVVLLLAVKIIFLKFCILVKHAQDNDNFFITIVKHKINN